MKPVKCFAADAARLGTYTTVDAGPRVIEVSRITGTVDKCGELDRRFRLLRRRRDRGERYRRLRLQQVDLTVTSLPPIDVYLLAGEYYVIDGNRRVAAVKRHGLEFMDANVTECVPIADRAAGQASVSRKQFEQETGLKNLQLAYPGGYAALLEESREFTAPATDARERARRWHSSFYLPACRLLAASPLAKRFPLARAGDLFVLVSRFYRELLGGYPPGISYPSLLSGYLFAGRIPGWRRRRLLRLAPFRLLLAVLRAHRGR